MAERKPLAQKFYLGQRCVLVLNKSKGWETLDGERCTITASKRRFARAWCADRDGRNGRWYRNQVGYQVDVVGRKVYVRESQLRAIDANPMAVSTWDAFEAATGFRPDRSPLTASRASDPELQRFYDRRAEYFGSILDGLGESWTTERCIQFLEDTKAQLTRLGFTPDDRHELLARMSRMLGVLQ